MFRRKKPGLESDSHTEQSLPDRLKRAPFYRRALAVVIDFVVAGTLFLGGVILPLVILDRKGWIDIPDWDITFSFYGNWYSILWLVFYFALLTWLWNGRTIGEWLCGIRVVSLREERIRFLSSLKRAFGFGLFQGLPGKNQLNKHDRMVGTIVIVDPIWKRKQKQKLRGTAGAVDDDSTDPAVESEMENAKRGEHV